MKLMKKILIGIVVLLGITALYSCGSTTCPDKQSTTDSDPILNISVYLDLSDRLIRDLTPNQTYRDTAIINYLVDYFKGETLGPNILQSENKMKVFFYPTPNDTEISSLAQGLSVDIGELEGIEKRKALEEMKDIFQKSLSQIYDETMNEKKWVGCDIWDFFSNKKVDNLCIKKDARNIVVILTDGYIFAENNKIKEDNAYSYILPQTLKVEGSSLIDRRKGDLKGKGLEVLMLEINPYQPADRDKMVSVLENWFTSMGVEKFVVADTDANLTNTETIIKNFLDN